MDANINRQNHNVKFNLMVIKIFKILVAFQCMAYALLIVGYGIFYETSIIIALIYSLVLVALAKLFNSFANNFRKKLLNAVNSKGIEHDWIWIVVVASITILCATAIVEYFEKDLKTSNISSTESPTTNEKLSITIGARSV